MVEKNTGIMQDFDSFPQAKPANMYFDEVLDKLMKQTTFFQDMAKEIVFRSLQQIREVPKWVVLIEENTRGCDFFYLLLKGNLGVYEGDNKIAQINGVQVFGEIGFFNGKRIATVLTEEKSYVAKITREFIEELDPKVQAVFYQNIAKELSVKISASNENYSAMLKEAKKKAATLWKTEKLSHNVNHSIVRHL